MDDEAEKPELQNLGFDDVGKAALLAALSAGTPFEKSFDAEVAAAGWVLIRGRVGSMEPGKVVAAVETAARREGLLGDEYWYEHALYHATIEAMHGICRGPLELGNLHRTAGLVFTVVSSRWNEKHLGGLHWLAVCLYGNIGAPRVGWEHVAIGLGVNHV